MKYFYIDNLTKQQCGPFELKDLKGKGIHPETVVWRSGMPDWTEARNVSELAYLFDDRLPILEDKPNPPQRSSIDISKQQEQANRNSSSSPNSTQSNQQSSRTGESNKWDDILPMPKNWLVESILLSIFCCSPISVVGIFYASKVESLYYTKDYEGALRASKNAKNWTLAGILFLPLCYVILTIFGAMTYLVGL
ncbi:MAG: CD225/dispanin family protein [Dysgonomonas sp.]|nr:CD225/dispanin family protein [Dysgonomonas sp.]